MHLNKTMLLLLAATAQTVFAQCTADLLVDNFAKITNGFLPNDASPKQFNLIGGDYGSAGADFVIDTDSKTLSIVAGTANVGQPEPLANPNTAVTFNYWFAKFDRDACYNLTQYSGISFDLVAPLGSDMNFTLTQKVSHFDLKCNRLFFMKLAGYMFRISTM